VDTVKQAYSSLTANLGHLRAVTPVSNTDDENGGGYGGGGAYANEADVHEPDYISNFWGSQKNYDRLLSIKGQYDPQGLLDCWHCVGWKGVDHPQYSCML
jgi:hypothetical protein